MNFSKNGNLDKLTIYRRVAKEALINWNGLSEEEAEKKVRTETFDELEGQVWATGSLNYAVDAIVRLLNLDSTQSEVFRNIVIDKKNITLPSDYEAYLETIKSKDCGMVSHARPVFYILSAIHDGWVKDNAKKFNQEGRESKRYQHLPIELIGWKETKADLLFLAPIIESIGTPIDESALEQSYSYLVSEFLESKEIEKKSDLIAKIMKGGEFYAPLTEKNTAKSIVSATAIVDKVFEVNPIVYDALSNAAHI